MAHTHIDTPHEIPPAFYRRDDPPLPPPGEPHRREWPNHGGREPNHNWMLYLVPVCLFVVALVLAALKFVVLLHVLR